MKKRMMMRRMTFLFEYMYMYINDALKYISFPCQKSLIDDTLISLSNDCLSDWMIPQFFLPKKKTKKISRTSCRK